MTTNNYYTLVVSNDYGTNTSSGVSVIVLTGAPGISQDISPLSLDVYAGYMLTYSVVATGSEPFTYAWFEDGTAIPGATNSSYTFALPVGTNTFQCGVSNLQSGSVYTYSSTATLIGAPAPEDAFGANLLSYGPVAFWRLNEPSGSTTAYDYVGQFNGAYGSDTTNGLPGIPNPPFLGAPKDDLGVWMDNTGGANGFVTTPSINMTLSNATLLCWVYPNGTQNDSEGLVYARNGNADGINYGGNNTMAYTWNNNSATYDWSSGLAIPVNTWSFLALTITPSNAVACVFNTNGEVSNTNSVPNPAVAIEGGFALGADPQTSTLSTRIFNGEMDDVAVFNYALTSAELRTIYSVGSTGLTITIAKSGGNIIVSWPFGALYSAPAPNGPWTIVSGATSPYTIAAPSTPVFYRAIASP